jgi:hypothetical protein
MKWVEAVLEDVFILSPLFLSCTEISILGSLPPCLKVIFVLKEG